MNGHYVGQHGDEDPEKRWPLWLSPRSRGCLHFLWIVQQFFVPPFHHLFGGKTWPFLLLQCRQGKRKVQAVIGSYRSMSRIHFSFHGIFSLELVQVSAQSCFRDSIFLSHLEKFCPSPFGFGRLQVVFDFRLYLTLFAPAHAWHPYHMIPSLIS